MVQVLPALLLKRLGIASGRITCRFPTFLDTLRAVDRHLGLRTDLRLGSTDANLPLSLGIPSVSLGAGGDGGGAHTRAEWYSAVNRELGLRRILMLTLAMMEWAGRGNSAASHPAGVRTNSNSCFAPTVMVRPFYIP